MTKPIRKQMKMHSNLLMQTIKRQAGTLTKAILEGVMNSVDAKATRCDIALASDVLIIEDDGGGFPTEEMIDHCFNTFGQPHDAAEEKIYANFRLGRGQLFAHGHNIWESGKFTMDVDINKHGLEWDLHKDQDTGVDGCRIMIYLYEQLSPSDLAHTIRELSRQVKYVSIPVTLNDEQISRDPAEQQWDYESDTCWIRAKRTGDIAVYNLGVFVRDMSGHQYGMGGELVSKQQLTLNVARNDIMVSECPIWREAKKFLEQASGREVRKRTTMDSQGRQRMVMDLLQGKVSPEEAATARLLTDVNGRHWSLRQITNKMASYPNWSVAEEGDRLGDKIHQNRIAFVFAKGTQDRFDAATPSEFMAKLVKIARQARVYRQDALDKWKFKSFDKIKEGFKETYLILQPDQLYEAERQWQLMCEYEGGLLQSYIENEVAERPRRKMVIGEADHAWAWTDGATYIALGRDFLSDKSLGSIGDIIAVGHVLLHEYCHGEPTTGTHEHSQEFYELYHNASKAVGIFAENVLKNLPQRLETIGRRLTREQLKAQDQLHKLNQKHGKVSGLVAAQTKE